MGSLKAQKRLSLLKVNPCLSVFHYSEYTVHGQSAFFIKKLWTLNNVTNLNPVLHKSILPNGCFNIAVIDGPGIVVRQQSAHRHLTKGVYYCGQITKALEVDILAGTKATMIQLFPWTPVHFLFAVDLSSFTDSIILIHELPLNLPIRWNYLLDLPSEAQIHRYIVTSLAGLVKQTSASQSITKACRIIVDRRGDVSVTELATELQCSARHLQKLFKTFIGLSPKEFAVITKLRESIDAMAYPNSIPYPKLTELALVYQFYDQAHFINTFRSIASTTPKQFNPEDYLLALKK